MAATHMDDDVKREVLQRAKHIAIVGLSPDVNKASYHVASFLLERGYNIIPIYPKGGSILGKKVYVSLRELFVDMVVQGVKCDIIDIFRKSEALPSVLNEICTLENLESFDKHRICVWVQLGLQSSEAAFIAEQHGLMYEEDSCIKLEYMRIFSRSG